MSIDSKIEATCDHKVFEEQVQIENDLKTIPIPRTLASSTRVNLLINGYEITQDNPVNGWRIEQDSRFQNTRKSKIVLNKKRKSMDDFYHITYFCLANACPKCQGLRIINDESYSKLGKVVTVENEDKLLQEVKKGLTTILGSNPFHTWLGTKISQLVGSKIFNVELLKSQILEEIGRFFEKYQDIQIQQGQYQTVTDREAFQQLLSVDVTQDSYDISYWTIAVIFQNRTGNDMLYEKKFEIPGPKNLLYGKN